MVDHAIDDFFSWGGRLVADFSPIVRINARADDDVAHGLGNGQKGDFAGGFRLMVDAVRRAEEKRFHAKLGFQQALG